MISSIICKQTKQEREREREKKTEIVDGKRNEDLYFVDFFAFIAMWIIYASIYNIIYNMTLAI